MQEGTTHVQRQVGAVDYTLEQQQELGNNFLDVVRHENLAAEELDLSFMGAEVLTNLGEVQNPLQVERIVHVQVNPEQRVLKVREHPVIEALVLLLGAIAGLL